MKTPNFKSQEDVVMFLEGQLPFTDSHALPLVSHYVEACSLDDEKVDLDELNTWLREELSNYYEGYEGAYDV